VNDIKSENDITLDEIKTTKAKKTLQNYHMETTSESLRMNKTYLKQEITLDFVWYTL